MSQQPTAPFFAGQMLFPPPNHHCQSTEGTSTHTHTRLTALFPGLPRSAGTRKVKPILILLKQETVSGSGISWAICKSAPCSRQITTPATHCSVFLQVGCLSCRPTNSVKALKALALKANVDSATDIIDNLMNQSQQNRADLACEPICGHTFTE